MRTNLRGALAAFIVFGLAQAQSPAPTFEVVSIKPNKGGPGIMIRIPPGGRFDATNITTKLLIQEAYGVKESQISGAPAWIDSEHYDIQAKTDDSYADAERKLGREEQIAHHRQLLQSLLADRFKLTLHHEAKEMPILALVVAKNGPKLHEVPAPPPPDEAPPKPPTPGGPPPRGGIWMRDRGKIEGAGIQLSALANVLSMQLGRIVLDKTGLKGYYEFTLKWTPEEGEGPMFKGAGGPPGDTAPSESAGPTIFTAVQEQLGLKLESQKGPVDTLVIDHIERPSEN